MTAIQKPTTAQFNDAFEEAKIHLEEAAAQKRGFVLISIGSDTHDHIVTKTTGLYTGEHAQAFIATLQQDEGEHIATLQQDEGEHIGSSKRPDIDKLFAAVLSGQDFGAALKEAADNCQCPKCCARRAKEVAKQPSIVDKLNELNKDAGL